MNTFFSELKKGDKVYLLHYPSCLMTVEEISEASPHGIKFDMGPFITEREVQYTVKGEVLIQGEINNFYYDFSLFKDKEIAIFEAKRHAERIRKELKDSLKKSFNSSGDIIYVNS